MKARLFLALLLACALTSGLAACGGGGEASSSTAATPQPPRTAETTPAPQPGSSPAKPHAHAKRSAAAAEVQAERRAAGSAAAFVVPRSDNSVPTFGSEASATESRSAEDNLRAYFAARAAHNWAKACTYLSASTREGYEKFASASAKSGAKPTCARVLPVLAPISSGVPANPLTGHLVALRAQGASGFALFYGPPDHQQYMVPMNREAGEWRPTQAAPIAYPPGAPPSTSP